VKSGKQQIQFNEAIREEREALERLINWIGTFDEKETQI